MTNVEPSVTTIRDNDFVYGLVSALAWAILDTMSPPVSRYG